MTPVRLINSGKTKIYMSKYNTILNTDKLWAKERRQPGHVEICFGLKHENEIRGHAVFISGVIQNESCLWFYRPAKNVENFVFPSNNTLIIENYIFRY